MAFARGAGWRQQDSSVMLELLATTSTLYTFLPTSSLSNSSRSVLSPRRSTVDQAAAG